MNNSTCSYCGSSIGIPATAVDKVYCGFCEMFVEASKDGERLDRYQKKEYFGYEDIQKPTPILLEMHTKSLLELLRYMREERRSQFNLMRVMKQGASQDTALSLQEREFSADYEFITKKCFVVENILRDRMGYIPKKITDNLIIAYEQRVNDPYNERKMQISRPERVIEKDGGLTR